MCFYSGLLWNNSELTYWWLIYLPRWLILVHDGKVSLHSWEFTFISFFGLSVHSLNKHYNNSEFHFWNAYLYIPLKIIILIYNHSSTRFPYLSVNCHYIIYKSTYLEITSLWWYCFSNYISPPSTVAIFLATHLMAVMQLSVYSVFYDGNTSIWLGLP